MSRIDDEQQPREFAEAEGAAEQPAHSFQEPSEPRLLTRHSDDGQSGDGARARRKQHPAEAGLSAWAGRLARGRRERASAIPPREAEARDAKRRRILWWTVRVGGALVALVLIIALAFLLELRHSLTASLAQVDGEAHLTGLHAPVTVTRDAQGVPSITAANLDDLLFAQGYVTASDRLWQMDGLRRHAAGELAAILGPGLVDHDRRQRYLQIRAAADRAVAALPRDQYAQLEAYARGVNAFIDSHHGSLPMEFTLLAYRPAPWSPRDSLLVSLAIYEDMSTGFPQKMNREALSAHLPANLLNDLYPVGSWRDLPPAAQGRNMTAPHDVEQIPLDPSQSRLGTPGATPGDLLALSNGLAGAGRCEGCRAGSNNWAVNGLHTASGGAMVSNDMHLNLAIPDVWYEASLHADLLATEAPGSRLDVSGFTLPGVPFVIVGRNTHVAWGLTNLGADVEDLRVEHLRGEGENTEFQRADGTWTLAHHRPEHIHVRGGRDVTLDVITTEHMLGDKTLETPVVSPLYPTEHRTLSLAWTAYDPATVTSPFLPINTAADGSSLVASFASFGGPTLNLVWADDGNHIGYHALGRIPVRGPAIQHPRPVAAPINLDVKPGTMPPDEGDDPGPADPGSGEPASGTGSAPDNTGDPQASIGTEPHWVLSAYHPVRRRRAVPATPPSRSRASRLPARSLPARRGRRSRLPASVQAEATPLPAPAIPEPQPLNYTVGSPLSPVPVDALDASQEWSGYIAYADLPAVTDPPNGLLATANSRITPDDYPWAVTTDWVDPFRTERIVHMLSGRHALTAADMLRVETDVHSDVDEALAHRVAYALDHASAKALAPDAKRLKQAADLLRDFHGDMSANSPAAALVSSVRTQLWPALLIPQILGHDAPGLPQEKNSAAARQAAVTALLYTSNERTTALELIVQHQPARWLPHPYTRWNDFLAAVTESALKISHAPGDLTHWQYGQLHTVEIAHPLLGDQRLLSSLLGIQGTTGVLPAPGDATTIRQIGKHFGPSERFTADLSSPTAAFANITTGESEDGLSPWYLDQFRPWFNGTTFAMPLNGGSTTHSLRLLPQ